MQQFKTMFSGDMTRYGKGAKAFSKKFHYYFRKVQCGGKSPLALYYRLRFARLKEKHGLEIPNAVKIGKGLFLGHPYNITINLNAKIGENCNLHKGVVIGQENRGRRKGNPTIGNCVWIGINAAVVGNITIGDDVLIAPNSFVNCDVPSHSVVYGNPCVVHHRDRATEGYINNKA